MMESSAKKGPRDRSRSRTVSACSSPIKHLNATRVCFRPQILLGTESDSRPLAQNAASQHDSNSKSGLIHEQYTAEPDGPQESQMTVDILKQGSAVTDLTTDSQQKRRVRSGKTPAAQIVGTPEEDAELRRLVEVYGDQSWHRLCKLMPNKTEIRCFKRWKLLQRA